MLKFKSNHLLKNKREREKRKEVRKGRRERGRKMCRFQTSTDVGERINITKLMRKRTKREGRKKKNLTNKKHRKK